MRARHSVMVQLSVENMPVLEHLRTIWDIQFFKGPWRTISQHYQSTTKPSWQWSLETSAVSQKKFGEKNKDEGSRYQVHAADDRKRLGRTCPSDWQMHRMLVPVKVWHLPPPKSGIDMDGFWFWCQRKEPVALTAKVHYMFYCLIVQEYHRHYLRYLLSEDNNVNKKVIEFRMKVHIFWNSPLPAVAIYCMRRGRGTWFRCKTIHWEAVFCWWWSHLSDHIWGGWRSFDTNKRILAESNLQLHKLGLNKQLVMEAFPAEDHGRTLSRHWRQILRCYVLTLLSTNQRIELCILSDASTVAIGTVAYLRIAATDGQYHMGFVMGKSKLAPCPAHKIPRLELCAAVLAVEL